MEPVVIVGAGPAGMILAYQLASNGVPVRVFERHKDFDREFRGEFAQPSLLDALDRLGILAELRRTGRLVPIEEVRMHFRARAFAVNAGRDGEPAGYAVHQPSFLALLHAQCGRFPGYRLDLGTPVTALVKEGARVRGVLAGGERVDARLVVVCNGRGSALRGDAGLEADALELPYTLLWVRFPLGDRPDLLPGKLEGFITGRAFYVLYPTYGQQAQLMWRRARRHPLDWKAPAAELKSALLADAPARWSPILERFDESTERQPLRVMADRLRRWWAPGVLFLGDAAHTMSPVGGQGLTMAIRDAVVAANHFLDGLRFDEETCARIEAERRPEIEKIQAFQLRAGRVNDAPPAVQWLLTRAVIPLATRLQGASYLREVQHGVTRVQLAHAVPIVPPA